MKDPLQKLRAIVEDAEEQQVSVDIELLAAALDSLEKQKALHDKLWSKNLQNHVMQITRASRAFNDPRVKGKNNQTNAMLDALGIDGRRGLNNRNYTYKYALLLIGKYPYYSIWLGAISDSDNRAVAAEKKRLAVELIAEESGTEYSVMRQRILRGIQDELERPPENRMTLEVDLESLPKPPRDYTSDNKTPKKR